MRPHTTPPAHVEKYELPAMKSVANLDDVALAQGIRTTTRAMAPSGASDIDRLASNGSIARPIAAIAANTAIHTSGYDVVHRFVSRRACINDQITTGALMNSSARPIAARIGATGFANPIRAIQ